MAFMTQAKKGMSAKQLQTHLGLKSYQTAWYLCHRIRKAMAESGGAGLMGIVEVDETHVSGRYDKRRKRQPWDTTIVAGMVERGGRVRTQKIPTASKQVLVGMVKDNVQPTATVMTDELAAYKSLGGIVAKHDFVTHSAEEWVRGDVHTNTIEGCWSLLKRGIVGSFHKISVKHSGPLSGRVRLSFQQSEEPGDVRRSSHAVGRKARDAVPRTHRPDRRAVLAGRVARFVRGFCS